MTKPRPSPLSIRLSDDERALLVEKAGDLPLGAFIKHAALGAAPARRSPRIPVLDKKLLATVLGLLGKSHLSSNLNQLAKAANMGALPVTPELEAELRAACADIRATRTLLLKSLGIAAPSLSKPLTDVFGQSAESRP